MYYTRMPIEIESPEQIGYGNILNNLTESSYTDTVFGKIGVKLKKLPLAYTDHRGHVALRNLLTKESIFLTEENVITTIGAAGALFIIATTLLEPGDEMIVVKPNYATNIETPKAIGAHIKYIDLKFENEFKINMNEIRNSISPKTKYISVTHPHNPTGVCLSLDELQDLAHICEKENCYLLVDETYRDMVFNEKLPLACDVSENVISVSSLSKSYGLPGIRVGWIMSRKKQLMETFLAAKEQIHICGSVLDEEVAYQFMLKKDKHFNKIRKSIKVKFEIIRLWMETQTALEWVEPCGGVVCFPRIADPSNYDVEKFYSILNNEHRTHVGPGHWFEMPKHYMRIGYGWPSKKELRRGLEAISESLKAAKL
jgi:aspartate/methionine/tyrosine aminotransferase